MATTMLAEAPAPEPRAYSGRTVTIRADLLPDEVVARRRVRELKRILMLGLAALLALLVAWYGLSVLQTSQAKSDLSTAQRQTVALQRQVQAFGPLVSAQTQSTAIRSELARLMVGDLRWKDMLATLRSHAPAGVTIGNVSGTVTSGAASVTSGSSTVGLGVLNETGHQEVGTLTISGTAPDKNSVAAYIDALTKVPGLAAPFPANVTGTTGKVTFVANVIITSEALGGRYATTTTTPQGGH